MKTTNNTVLIIGGTAGIGLESAKLFLAKGNKVIVTGRDKARLNTALEALPGATGIISDISVTADRHALAKQINTEFPEVNIVLNNAGQAYLYDLSRQENAFEKAQDEILTNYLAIIDLNEKLIPLLSTKEEAAIVNVSSVVAFVPGSIATYSASKAALHSYTQSLRYSLSKAGSIKVFELMPPLVDTEFSKPIGGSNGIAPSVVADDLLAALETDNYEIRVGNTQYIYDLYLKSPEEAFNAMHPAEG